jgi:hypothetical protein
MYGEPCEGFWELCKDRKVLRDGYVCKSELKNSLDNYEHQTEIGRISFSCRLMHQSHYFTNKGATLTLSRKQDTKMKSVWNNSHDAVS